MWIEIAKTIVGVFGPCPIVQWRAHDAALLRELLLAGCDAHAVGEQATAHPRWIAPDSVTRPPRTPVAALEARSGDDTVPLLQALLARADLNGLVLIADDVNALRKPLERIILAQGWRRHPAALAHGDYEGLSDITLPQLSFYQRMPPRAAALPRPDDMLRAGGSLADAHIARYALAASLVRPGDAVLDCACGSGYGAAIIAARSQARTITSIDPNADAVAYATASYGGADVSFTTGDAARLDDIPDASIDLIVAMDMLAGLPDWYDAARHFARILKPDGRLMASIPEHAAHRDALSDWSRLYDGLSDDFIIEHRFAQTAPSGLRLPGARRRLQQVALDADIAAEWIVVVASSNPFARARQLRDGFAHPAFADALAASGSPVVDLLRGYDNPWLYRTLVQMGERIADDAILGRMADWVLDTARTGSADQGAALCVAGYRALENRDADMAAAIIARIDAYQRHTGDAGKIATNPHVQRWRVSSAYLAGRLSELRGEVDDALTWFTLATRLDWRSFSPLLATKAIAASFHAARLCLARGDESQAIAFFRHGFNSALAAAAGDPADIIGSAEAPIAFGLTELAEVLDMGSQCTNALANMHLWRRSPAAFWRLVDTKRFGLATWTKDVEAENARLRRYMSPPALRIAS